MTAASKPSNEMPPLTQLARGAGCGCKLSAVELRAALQSMDRIMPGGPDVIIGAYSADDAAVVRVTDELAMVQSVDVFTPVVDDAGIWGAIAATNALSDIYAMGARPATALNVVGWPRDSASWDQLGDVLDGAAEVLARADCAMVGGHTIDSVEPIYGLSVTGFVDPHAILTNAGAQPGDQLVLTKQLGTGVVTTAAKLGHCPQSTLDAAVSCMTTSNALAAEVAVSRGATAATDVTGFGLMGHLEEMMRSSGTVAYLDARSLPAIEGVPELLSPIPASAPMGPLLTTGREPGDDRAGGDGTPFTRADMVCGGTRRNLAAANYVDWADVHESTRILATDAQTSGGLLLSVPAGMLDVVTAELSARADQANPSAHAAGGAAAWHIGEVGSAPGPGASLVPDDEHTRIRFV